MPSLKDLRKRFSKAHVVQAEEKAEEVFVERRKSVLGDTFARHAGLQRIGQSGSVLWIIEPPDGKDARFFFGKHKKKRVSEIAKGDPSYLIWLLGEYEKAESDEGAALLPSQNTLTEELARVIEYQIALHKHTGRR